MENKTSKPNKNVDIHSRGNSRGSNNNNSGIDIHRKQKVLVTELTPQYAEKIFKSIMRKRYNDKVSKEAVLHNLKQVKAEMGKLKKKFEKEQLPISGISKCMDIITNKIDKTNGK